MTVISTSLTMEKDDKDDFAKPGYPYWGAGILATFDYPGVIGVYHFPGLDSGSCYTGCGF